MVATVYFADGPKRGETMMVRNWAEPIRFADVSGDQYYKYADIGGRSGSVLVQLGVVAYHAYRYGENVGQYLHRVVYVAGTKGTPDPDCFWDDWRFRAYRASMPWDKTNPKGSEDFDSWWAMRMLELGREESDPLAYEWKRAMNR